MIGEVAAEHGQAGEHVFEELVRHRQHIAQAGRLDQAEAHVGIGQGSDHISEDRTGGTNLDLIADSRLASISASSPARNAGAPGPTIRNRRARDHARSRESTARCPGCASARRRRRPPGPLRADRRGPVAAMARSSAVSSGTLQIAGGTGDPVPASHLLRVARAGGDHGSTRRTKNRSHSNSHQRGSGRRLRSGQSSCES